MKPQNLEEKIVWYSLIGTYGFYFLGAHYIFIPALAWLLTLYLGKKLWQQTDNTPTEEKLTIPFTLWIWCISMLFMEIILLVAHANLNLGITQLVNSSINWARTWALMALFPLIGCLKIRKTLLCRAVCIICLQNLIFLPICYLASILNFPETLYISPLHFIGGNDSALYAVKLYGFEEGIKGIRRLQLFAPWAPAMGMIANIYFFLACQEPNKKWRLIGMIGSIAAIAASFSRLAVLCLFSVILLTWLLVNFNRPSVIFTTGLASCFLGMFASQAINFFVAFKEQFDNARANSSRIREMLGRIAIDRWQEEPIWGHGIVNTKGPKITLFMPIGTHHTWFGVLYDKGLLGLIALAFPLWLSFIDLLYKARRSQTAKLGLNILLVIFLFTFGERIDGLVYLYWPGLVMMGIALKE